MGEQTTSWRRPDQVFGLDEVVRRVQAAASHKQYRDNPVLVAMKVLAAAGVVARNEAA